MGLDARWVAAGCGGLIGGLVGSSLGIAGFGGAIPATLPLAAIGAIVGYRLASKKRSSAGRSFAPESQTSRTNGPDDGAHAGSSNATLGTQSRGGGRGLGGTDGRWTGAVVGGVLGAALGSLIGIVGFGGGIAGTLPGAVIGAFIGHGLGKKGARHPHNAHVVEENGAKSELKIQRPVLRDNRSMSSKEILLVCMALGALWGTAIAVPPEHEVAEASYIAGSILAGAISGVPIALVIVIGRAIVRAVVKRRRSSLSKKQ